MHIEHFTFNPFQERTCIVSDEAGFCAFVDPGCYDQEELSRITDFVNRQGLKPVCIMLTHAHFDHIYGMAALAKEYGIPVYAHRDEMFTIDTTNPQVCGAYGLELPETFPMLKTISEARFPSRFEWAAEGEVIEVGSLRFEVLETPGHSRGGLCFYERNEGVLFSGDTLFAGAIGRTDHPGGDYDLLMKSIFEKLMVLDGQVEVIPGHGPTSEIGVERETNPFLMPFNEPFEDEE
jgi:glyoxylase-like metal-dependent hydrolase (beta-lactamase superfamily II)